MSREIDEQKKKKAQRELIEKQMTTFLKPVEEGGKGGQITKLTADDINYQVYPDPDMLNKAQRQKYEMAYGSAPGRFGNGVLGQRRTPAEIRRGARK